jgi:CHASE2 domain-containing sensor protein
MKKRSKKADKKTAAEVTVPSPATVSVPAGSNDRGDRGDRANEIRRDFMKGILFMVLLVPFTIALEHSALGHKAEHEAYGLLQSLLSSDDVPFAVVNISKLEPQPIEVDGKTRAVTPRTDLKQIIDAIAEKRAKVIAIDINFAPLANGEYVDPAADPEFFQFCLSKNDAAEQQRLPVILAVDWATTAQSAARRPELLLADPANPNYKDLFACIRIPEATGKLPYKISDETGFEITTMGAAIADALRSTEINSRRLAAPLPQWAVQQFSIRELEYGVKVHEFPVDYSVLDTLRTREHTLATADPRVIKDQGDILSDKVVLVGNGTLGNTLDVFTVPGRSEQIPGVYLHAAAAYTLSKAPLYMLTWKGAALIDAAMSLFILGAIAAIRWHYKDRTTKQVAKHRLEKLFSVLVGLLAIVFGVWFVNYHRVLWVDFMLVVPLLLLNPTIEHQLEHAWRYVRRKAPGAVEAVVFEREKEDTK